MELINIYGKFNRKIIISKKLGIAIHNILDIDYFENTNEAMDYFVKYMTKNNNKGYEVNKKFLDEYASSSYFNNLFKDKADIDYLKNLVAIYYYKINNNYLLKKNRYFLQPSCEQSYIIKLIRFYNLLNKPSYINLITNEDDFEYKWFGLISDLYSKIPDFKYPYNPANKFSNYKELFNYQINSLKSFGNSIDNFIGGTNDFNMLDYIIENLPEINCISVKNFVTYYEFLEMILKNPKYTSFGKDINKCMDFFPKNIKVKNKTKIKILDTINKIRNKISHGDFVELKKQLEVFAKLAMKHYWFDYGEFTRTNWIINYLTCITEGIFINVMNEYLNNKQRIEQLKKL